VAAAPARATAVTARIGSISICASVSNGGIERSASSRRRRSAMRRPSSATSTFARLALGIICRSSSST